MSPVACWVGGFVGEVTRLPCSRSHHQLDCTCSSPQQLVAQETNRRKACDAAHSISSSDLIDFITRPTHTPLFRRRLSQSDVRVALCAFPEMWMAATLTELAGTLSGNVPADFNTEVVVKEEVADISIYNFISCFLFCYETKVQTSHCKVHTFS